MQTHLYTVPLALCLGLLAPAAMAQDILTPDKVQRQGMSYEEYTSLRDKMRMRMEQMQPQHAEPNSERGKDAAKPTPPEKTGGSYGQGFNSRKPDNETAGTAADRPERPRVERFNRVDRMRP